MPWIIHNSSATDFWKIFLKEAIDVNPDVKGLLCSYFMKTALLWEITKSNQWAPSSLLSCFWKCYCRLLQWVRCSYCPNFFIPQNNMFEGKIDGKNQIKLLRHLRTLYCEGYMCLLRCVSLSYHMSNIVHIPYIELVVKEPNNRVIARNIIFEYSACKPSNPSFSNKDLDIHDYFTSRIRCLLMYQVIYPTNSHQRFILKFWIYETLTELSMTKSNCSSSCNRSQYRSLTERMNMIDRCRTDSVCHFLYKAMLYHNSGLHHQALRLLQHSKKILASESMYSCKLSEPGEARRYDIPVETIMRKDIVNFLVIWNDQCIPELYIENHRDNVCFTAAQFPAHPLVCVFFLQYLCLRKLGRMIEAGEALYKLSLLVHYNNGPHIINQIFFRQISWQILGVCQQINGDDQAACKSYLTALQLDDTELIKVAACVRLGTILVKYIWKSTGNLLSIKCHLLLDGLILYHKRAI